MPARSRTKFPLAAPVPSAVPMPDLAALNASPFPGLFVSGELDDLESLPLEVVVTDKWVGYFNQRIIADLNQRHPGRISYVRLVPDVAEGMVIILPAKDENEYGAVAIDYTDTEAGASVNVRRPMQKLKADRVEGRLRVCQVVTRQAPNGDEYLAFVVKGSTTRPARKVTRKKSSDAASAKGTDTSVATKAQPAASAAPVTSDAAKPAADASQPKA